MSPNQIPRTLWVVEFVSPPGAFIAREWPEKISRIAMDNLIIESISTIPLGEMPSAEAQASGDPCILQDAAEKTENLKKHRWLFFGSPNREIALKSADLFAEAIGEGKLPWSVDDLSRVTEAFHKVAKIFNLNIKGPS